MVKVKIVHGFWRNNDKSRIALLVSEILSESLMLISIVLCRISIT